MKPEIHPAYKEIKVACSCGNSFVTGSTLGHDLHIEICSKCHPFYTGTQKLIDTAGRVDRFRQKYSQAAAKPVKAETQATESKKETVKKATAKKETTKKGK
ncbi:MAG TPA: 50S ribosomal protein L31 [Gammaproteobacteria bacterium]|nr:50S ribosomal protein L31 [Gammaproteobacteria bacterium]